MIGDTLAELTSCPFPQSNVVLHAGSELATSVVRCGNRLSGLIPAFTNEFTDGTEPVGVLFVLPSPALRAPSPWW